MSTRPTGASTVTDVAQLAGVSVSTVSRILNGSARVAAEKRAAVEAAVRKLQFRPNLSAQALRRGNTKTIGVLTNDLDSPYFTRATKGVEAGLQGSGYAPLVVPGHWNRAEELERARLLIARGVDALAILGGTLDDQVLLELSEQIPIAITGRQLSGERLTSFYADQVLGAKLATEHLIQLGHRRIAHIAGPRDHADANERQQGFLLAHREAGLAVDPRLIVPGDYTEGAGGEGIAKLVEPQLAFSAIFCANDQTLWGARLALHQRGLRVPEDVSLVGFDDIAASNYMTPPVSTVHQPTFELGREAASALLRVLRGEPIGKPRCLPLELVVRGTTAALR